MTDGARDFGRPAAEHPAGQPRPGPPQHGSPLHGPPPHAPPPHGSLADEAAKLADVAQLWLKARSAGAGGSSATTGTRNGDPWGAATDDATRPVDDGTAPECRTCPICRARRFADNLDPEVLAHLSDAVASLGAAVAALSRSRKTGSP
jgi:hypothetical protein